MESRSKRQRLILVSSNVSPQRPNLPARFESLNDDTLTTTLEFVGRRSYRSFGGLNKHCREVYLNTKGRRKKTFVYGYAPLSVIIGRYDDTSFKAQNALSKGVVYYNRRDILAWAVQQRNSSLLHRICIIAAQEGRIDLLDEMWNNVNDEDDKRYVFSHVDSQAACSGKLNVLNWLCTKSASMDKYECAEIAANFGHIYIIQWLREEQGLELFGELYCNAALGGHLYVMKWLREQEVPWTDYTFSVAAEAGNLDILQWLQDKGCPWPRGNSIRLYEENVKPEVIDWCRMNRYSDRIYRN